MVSWFPTSYCACSDASKHQFPIYFSFDPSVFRNGIGLAVHTMNLLQIRSWSNVIWSEDQAPLQYFNVFIIFIIMSKTNTRILHRQKYLYWFFLYKSNFHTVNFMIFRHTSVNSNKFISHRSTVIFKIHIMTPSVSFLTDYSTFCCLAMTINYWSSFMEAEANCVAYVWERGWQGRKVSLILPQDLWIFFCDSNLCYLLLDKIVLYGCVMI